ncbi:hypothetical protein GIB67_003491 [Kingdonia uniflora]|uniref:Uncharacterized protein n=1 Tax=Kingdonia uniflora TaxID=39325 RepID=A0A7J7MEK8_9MAGN|nr:hypothetical protein GIB67_003491 [Kingdonia uniflora]
MKKLFEKSLVAVVMKKKKISELPLKIIGVLDQAEKDEIVKSVMNLKNTDVEEGYTLDAAVSRQVVKSGCI